MVPSTAPCDAAKGWDTALRKRKSSKSTAKRTPRRRVSRKKSKLDRTEAALAAFAHEVRTPLTGILALGE
jgi:signal transduction histidine kinase